MANTGVGYYPPEQGTALLSTLKRTCELLAAATL